MSKNIDAADTLTFTNQGDWDYQHQTGIIWTFQVPQYQCHATALLEYHIMVPWCFYVFLNSINLYSVLLGRIVCTHSIRCDLLAGYCYRRSSVVCLCMCLLVTFVSPVKTAEPIEMLFGWLTRVGPRTTIRYGKLTCAQKLTRWPA